MAPRQVPKSRKAGSSSKLKAANSSPASSTASSPILYPETSVDSHSSPTSSSVRSKAQYTRRVPQNASQSKENVTVTVRFRPLSPREIRRGEEIAWYADGETIVRNEHTQSIAYAYDRVFGPTTTTRQVYDVSAQHVVNGAMEGTNGTIFAYGVTSSGKTHTMHGDQRSPGIISLAVKDAFDIIQETPRREFLLRVSYLEIYNEVVNDLLNPVGQNLRIREDEQGAFIEGIKEEVVLSPAHALSLIAAGEEHRHIGSTSFNLLSSRSHTMFTLTIESSPLGGNNEGEAVHLSQLNLIDLAGSESSKAATSGLRRKEGSYINKSLLTLGTVISKLTDRKASHVPFRDSKLTRLLQSSLSGHGRVSLICTVTPASSCTEETHNTLKFAHRAKHIEIQAAQNKIIDEKSLIKKYQNEIRQLKEELEELKQGIKPVSQLKDISEDNIVLLKQKLEEEEDAKAALLSRIQRLTKLILVSAKTPQTSRVSHRVVPRRRHSFGQEELAYLPYKRRDLMDEENLELYVSGEANPEIIDNDAFREEKKTRKHGLLNWLKLKKKDNSLGESSISDKSSAVKSNSTLSTPQGEGSNFHTETKLSEGSPLADQRLEPGEDIESLEDSSHEIETPEARRRTIDQMDILREQQKILSEEMALQSKSFKQLSEEATKAPENEEIKAEIINLNDDIKAKNDQIAELGKQILDFVMTSHDALDKSDIVQAVSEMRAQLNEKSFELEVKAADNRIIQEQLNQKTCECQALQEEVANLKQQLSDALELGDMRSITSHMQQNEEKVIQAQAFEIEELKLKAAELSELKEELELRNQKLAEESSYAKELASAAAVELRALSEEVASLMNRKMDSHKRSLGFISLAFLFITCSSAEFLIQQVTEGKGTENNSSYNVEANLGETRAFREERPSSKIVTIAGYSVIKGRFEPYESSVFEAAGYRWRLVLYVIGNKNDGGAGHISLYVRMEETESLPYGWEVNVDLKLFVHNPKTHKYLTVTDGTVKRYNAAKKEWGFGKLISLSIFENTNNGYIVQDTCSFGAEILIVKPAEIQEKVTFISNPPNNVFTWKILRFSSLEDKFYYSADFLVGDRYWRLGFNPKGDGDGRPHALPLFLFAQGFKENAVATNTWGAVNLRLKNQRNSNHRQLYSAAWYPIRSDYGVGVNNIILLSDLKDPSKGYLVNDAIIFEAEMVKVSVTNIVSV